MIHPIGVRGWNRASGCSYTPFLLVCSLAYFTRMNWSLFVESCYMPLVFATLLCWHHCYLGENALNTWNPPLSRASVKFQHKPMWNLKSASDLQPSSAPLSPWVTDTQHTCASARMHVFLKRNILNSAKPPHSLLSQQRMDYIAPTETQHFLQLKKQIITELNTMKLEMHWNDMYYTYIHEEQNILQNKFPELNQNCLHAKTKTSWDNFSSIWSHNEKILVFLPI